MATVTLSEDALRGLLQRAVADALAEQRDLLREIVAEAMEEVAMIEAIEEGRQTERVSRSSVFDALRGETEA